MSRPVKTREELAAHPFLQESLVEASRAFDPWIREWARTGRQPKPLSFSPYGAYKQRVARAMGDLFGCCAQLEFSVAYLSSFQQSARMKKVGLNRSSHLGFTIENYLVRSQAVYDRALHLVEVVFDLGTPITCISHEFVIGNRHVKRRGVSQLLKSLKKVTGQFKFDRNQVAHGTPYVDQELLEIEAYELFLDLRPDDPEVPLQRFISQRITRSYVAKKQRIFERVNAEVFGALYALLTESERVYKGQLVTVGVGTMIDQKPSR